MRAIVPTLLTAAFAGGIALSACITGATATTPARANSGGKTCFWRSEVSGFHQPRHNTRHGNESILVDVGVNRTYLFETLGSCPDINWSETIGFDQRGPGQICGGLDVDLIVPGPIGPQRCPVKMIRPLTREEAKAY